MAAITAEKNISSKDGLLVTLPIAANTKILNGALVCADGDGLAVNATAVASRTVMGVATETVDNTGGAASALSIGVRTGLSLFANSGLTQANIGYTCYVSDNQTVRPAAAPPAVNIAVGILRELSSLGAWVEIQPSDLMMSILSVVTSLETYKTLLASEDIAGGAGQIGIHDTATNFTAKDVEGALAECAALTPALVADLAATTEGNGASLIGVFDGTNKFTATDLLGILLELEARIAAVEGP